MGRASMPSSGSIVWESNIAFLVFRHLDMNLSSGVEKYSSGRNIKLLNIKCESFFLEGGWGRTCKIIIEVCMCNEDDVTAFMFCRQKGMQ